MPFKGSDRLTVLLAASAVLGVVDSMLPRPLPFFRIGLANIPAVIAVFRYGWLRTLELNALRSFTVALLTGTLGTPTFVLSLSGAVISATVMGAVQGAFRGRLSYAGVSVSGAVASLWAQLLAAGLILNDIPLANMVPFLSLWGVVSGVVTGIAASGCSRWLGSR